MANPDKLQKLTDHLQSLRDRGPLIAPGSYIREMQVPNNLLPALSTGRGALVTMAAPKPEDVTPEYVAALHGLIRDLIDTNTALREHATATAQLVSQWMQAFKHLQSLALQIEHFASFRSFEADEDEME